MDAVARATREVETRMPVAPPPPEPEIGAVIARLARSFARFAKHPFAERRATLKQVFRSILVVDGAIPEFTVSGAFLGEIAHTRPGQQSKGLRARLAPQARNRPDGRRRGGAVFECTRKHRRAAPPLRAALVA
jgi:hypothetical protein